MKLSELYEDTSEAEDKVMFRLQQYDQKSKKWENLADDLYTKDEAQEFLDSSVTDEPGVEERGISVDKKTILTRKIKNKSGPNVLARHASPEVHKRNAEFFKKYT